MQSGCGTWVREQQSGLPGHCAEWVVMTTGEMPHLKCFLCNMLALDKDFRGCDEIPGNLGPLGDCYLLGVVETRDCQETYVSVFKR